MKRKLVTPDGKGPQPIYAGARGAVARAVDGLVGTFAPGAAHRMRVARMKSNALLAFEAAQITAHLPRPPRSGSADAEILPDLQTMRDACRDLDRNDAHFAAGKRAHQDNIIGSGIVPQSTVLPEETGMTEDQCQVWRAQCEAWFAEWAEDEADITGNGTFYDLQRLVAGALMPEGEAIVHAVVENGRIACDVIDPDRLVSPGMMDTRTIRGGVELNKFSRPVAYHILQEHPSDIGFLGSGSTKPSRIAAVDGRYSIVQHIFRRERAGQTRGVPWLASARPYQHHLHNYLNAELVAARSASNWVGTVKRNGDSLDPSITPTQGVNGTQDFLEDLDAGQWFYAQDGEELQVHAFNRPGAQFEPFVKRILRAIWAAPGLAYELVTKDFGAMNYSSARTLLLECRRSFDVTRTQIVRQFCRPWWSNVILAGVASGRLTPPAGFLRDPRPFLRVRWVPPAYGWVDPVTEIEAASQSIEANLSTPYDEAARAGQDAEQVLLARARFLRFAAETEANYGLEPGSLTRKSQPGGQQPAAAAQPGQDQQDQQDQDEEQNDGQDDSQADA